MCLAEIWEGERGGVSRRAILQAGVAAGASLAGGLAFPGVAAGAERARRARSRGGDGLRLTWFGTNGWKIQFRAHGTDRTILLDPFFGRFKTGFFTGTFNPKTPLPPAAVELIDRHVPTAVDHILIGHGHWDHIADVPAIQRRTGAMVIGSETHRHLMRGFGLPDEELVIVKGGEVIAFDGYSIEVFAGLHSLGATRKYVLPGHLLTDPPAPKVVGDLPEGDTLCYLLTIDDGPSLFLMSSANFVERAFAGIRPDVALVAGLFRDHIRDYTDRLIAALGHPPVLLPTHWDNFERPYDDGPHDLRDIVGERGSLDTFVRELKRSSPRSRVVVLDFFETFEF
ncbi:MAG TPA: MBL fold metallo-hydrolase [Acidimicrobiia bacterium]|jgi:L-ascorbate metabolism protein UlaG (beta-lactamase superfamily)|nr:MBL fold metallo-hydrolase [Acidimicrobiia bacterium]